MPGTQHPAVQLVQEPGCPASLSPCRRSFSPRLRLKLSFGRLIIADGKSMLEVRQFVSYQGMASAAGAVP
jgi:hypothetical protein